MEELRYCPSPIENCPERTTNTVMVRSPDLEMGDLRDMSGTPRFGCFENFRALTPQNRREAAKIFGDLPRSGGLPKI